MRLLQRELWLRTRCLWHEEHAPFCFFLQCLYSIRLLSLTRLLRCHLPPPVHALKQHFSPNFSHERLNGVGDPFLLTRCYVPRMKRERCQFAGRAARGNRQFSLQSLLRQRSVPVQAEHLG